MSGTVYIYFELSGVWHDHTSLYIFMVEKVLLGDDATFSCVCVIFIFLVFIDMAL